MPIVAKLDELGKPAWIALMILGFMVWWPVGLATLAFIIGSGRMSWKVGSVTRWHEAANQMRSAGTWWHPSRSSGNRAFDEYREETLRRLEDEQREFQDFSRSLAGGEGQGRVRSVHGGAARAYRAGVLTWTLSRSSLLQSPNLILNIGAAGSSDLQRLC